MAGWQNGLCRGLQILLYWFNSGTGLQEKSFQRSSVVEQSAVNRSVVGSSPTAGAIKKRSLLGSFFLCVPCVRARTVKGSLASVSVADGERQRGGLK